MLQVVARMIATDRRAVVLASERAEILLANAPANRIPLDSAALTRLLDWPTVVARARDAGSVQVSTSNEAQPLEGEVVHLSLGAADCYLLRLAESDQEAAWLRNRARSARLMRVAHDLRTPIQSLLAIAETGLSPDDQSPDDKGADDKGSDDGHRALLQQAAELALDHIDNVLNVIRGEGSVAGLQPDEDFCVTEELRSLLAMVSPIVRQRGAEMNVTLDPPEDVWLHGPVRFLRALFQNMIDNSAKYGGEMVEILLSCRPLSETMDGVGSRHRISVSLEVRDLGGGLPPERKAQLNEALGQAGNLVLPPTATASESRPSAGLNVLAHALRQLGGELEVFDRGADGAPLPPDGSAGTVVTGTLLRASFCLPEGEALAPLAPPAAPTDGTAPLAGLRLLIVEDSPSSRDWLVQILRAAGARVYPAGNGMEALALLARKEVHSALDLVMTDMTLPYMNGFELAQRITAARIAGRLTWSGPILGLTAHVDDQIRASCAAAGIARVLEKPIRPSALCQAIREALTLGPATAAPPAEAGDVTLANPVVEDLLQQFGTEGTRRFMTRAHDEAGEVAADLRREGVRSDTGRRLHAATGACSLTGLTALESALRQIEIAVKAQETELDPHIDTLEATLRATTDAIRNLA
ncbi:hybrid sensor histidine kinase/response regulator [Oceanicola sp. S124]|uniref:hybrid sensor histidine kinase/response regulator n=1 Tax=Oceanicola sp. S124 TaxID=1042378 RepID=UPI000255972C|nr:response regulator [Oceanicola sp. S124]